ncbi:MAG: polysaccharide deacetylase family protein [Candidatus Methanoculleus thermohydrogenotrophicum]|jgi:peptidoglycan/xylan/chitin deacetylase (PgdA/CDA1 family)
MTTRGSASLTIDLEDWYHIPSVCGSTFSEFQDVEEFFVRWDGRYDYLTDTTGRVLQILDHYRVPATFFVVADVIDHYPGLVESIVDHGHEIACHGLHHSCVIDSRTKEPLISPDAFRRVTARARRALERISGEKVVGYRAPNALIAGWMIDILDDLGFGYDSSVSVNSFYNKSDSALKGVSSAPYYPEQNELEPTDYRGIVEFPWPYYDIGLKIPTGGGPMLRFLGAHVIMQGLRQSLRRGHTVFYFHCIDIADDEFPNIGNKRPFYWTIKGEVVEKRILRIIRELRDRGVAVKPLREVLEE